ncbi:MAG: lipopolysaccharide biosynthesis protein [Cytophagaceae bacterium]|nr:lipopolysaccharide biosynthesis protein [Cytophagaceae bacterium]
MPPEPDDDVLTIDLGAIVQFFREKRAFIAKVTLGFALLGIVSALLALPEFTSEARLMPELKSNLAGNFSQFRSLADLAGVNIDNVGGEAEAVRPDLYPNILQSTPFLMHVMAQKVVDPDFAQPVTVEQYLLEKAGKTPQGKAQRIVYAWQRILAPDPEKLRVVPDAQNISKAIRMSRQQEELAKSLKSRITSILDKKTGIITISVKMPDPVVAATLARLTTEYLTQYVVEYRTEKSRQQAEFLRQRVAEAKRRYQSAEYALQSYRDRNRNSFLNVARIDEQRLQTEFTLTQQVYNELSRQMEQAQIKVREETPVFKLLDPPQVPNRRSEPKRTIMVLVYTVLGAVVGTVWAFLRRGTWRRYFGAGKT